MHAHLQRQSYGLAAGCLAAGEAGFELVRVAMMQHGAPGYTGLMSAFSVAFIVVLASAGAALALEKKVGWLFGVVSAVGSIAWGIAVAAGGSRWGAFFMASGLAMIGCLAKSLAAFRRHDDRERILELARQET